MSQYKIVIDSCGELPEDLKADGHFCTVPLLLDVDGYQITDDETFNQRDFLQRVKACIQPEIFLPVSGALYECV